jgi:MarR family 2-MHQ and catechol resistance regulon transcriptional repressor
MTKQAESADESNGTYNAIIATYKVMQRGMAKLLSEEGLTLPQFTALRVMARHGPTPMKTLSEELLVTAANITGIVDRLESKGLVTRVASSKDRRATIVELTAGGMKLQEEVTKKYIGFLQKALQRFSSDEQRTLSVLLAKLREEMSELYG